MNKFLLYFIMALVPGIHQVLAQAPASPVLLPPALISSTGFEARWQEIVGLGDPITNVLIDVAATAGTSFDSPFEPYSELDITSEAYGRSVTVANLLPNTTYAWRLRVENNLAQSSYSAVQHVTTKPHPQNIAPAAWLQTFEGAGYSSFIDVTDDESGNIYATGLFENSITIGTTTLATLSPYGLFLTKSNSSGVLQWTVSVASQSEVEELNVKHYQGYLYVAGQTENTIDIDPGAGVQNVGPGTFFAKYQDSDGALVWAKGLEGNVGPWALAVSSAGIFIAGEFEASADFDPGAASQVRTASGSDDDGYVASYSLDGIFQWVGVINSLGYDFVNDLIVDGNDVYIAGAGGYDTQVDIDPTANVNLVPENTTFLVKLNGLTGAYLWGRDFQPDGIGGHIGDQMILADLGSSILMLGDFSGEVYFGNEFVAEPTGDGYDVFMAEFSKSLGNAVFGRTLGTGDQSECFIDQAYVWENTLYFGGHLSGSIDFNSPFGGGERNARGVDPEGYMYGGSNFIAAYSFASGSIEYQWVKTFPSVEVQDVWLNFLANSNGLYAAGSFNGAVDFNPYTGNMPELGDEDAFFVKYDLGAQPPAPPAAPVATAAANVLATSFTANWSAVAGASYYKIDVSADDFDTFEEGYAGLTVQPETTIAVTGLEPLTDYKYRVRAITGDGASANSNVITVSTAAAGPPPPANFASGIISNAGFIAKWNAVPDATGYELELSNDGFQTVMPGYDYEIAGGPWLYWYWNLVGLEPSTEYQARIRAVDATGTSVNSVLTVTTQANPAAVSSNLWVDSFGSTSEEFITAIASDADGNVYVTGKTSELALTIGSFTLNPIGQADIFIAKYNSAGVVQWAKRVGGSLQDEGWHITLDGWGVYVTGTFSGTADFDPNAGTTNLIANGTSPHIDYNYLDDGFIAKYNLLDGSLIWAKSLGNAWPHALSGKAMYTEASGLFITGTFVGVNDFNPDAGTYNLTSAGANDIFLADFDKWTGAIQWALSLGGAQADVGVSITGDVNNIYLAGKYEGAMDLNPGAGTQNVTGRGSFVSKFALNGALQWAKSYQSIDQGYGEYFNIADLALDNDNIYAVGNFYGVADFDPNGGTYQLVSSTNAGFGTKLTKAGVHVWSGNTYSYSGDGLQPTRVIADAAGLYVVGISQWSVDFDPGPGEANRGSKSGDIFIARYNSADGGYQWAKTFGSWDYEFTRSAAELTNDGLYVAGAFLNTVNFDPYTGSAFRTSNGNVDGFIARYESTSPPPPPAPAQLTPAFVSNNGVNTEWNGVADVTDYRVDISLDNFSTFWAHDIPMYGGMQGVSHATWLYLEPNTNYKMRIRSMSPGGLRSDFSNVVSFTTLADPVPASSNMWTSTFGSTGTEDVSGIATDASGNIYTTGYYSGNITIGSTPLTHSGAGDVFFAKYNSSGTVQWAKSLSSTLDERGISVAVDATGVYITGYLWWNSNLDFDPDGGVQLISPQGTVYNAFMAKYSLVDGSFIWAKPLNDSWNVTGESIHADGTSVYITGAFIGTNDFDPGAGTVSRTALGEDDVYLARYSAADGSLVWVTTFGSSNGDDMGYSVMLDGDFVYTSGYLIGTGDIDPGAGTNTISGAYFSKFNVADGSVVWAKNAPGAIYAFDLDKDASGLLVAGAFAGSVDMDPGAGIEVLTGLDYATTGYVGRYTLTDGDFISAHVFKTSGTFFPRRIIADNTGYYIGGNATWGMDFDPGIGEENRHAWWADAILARYTTAGDLVWAKTIGSTSNDLIRGGLALTSDGLYAAGSFTGTVNFDPYLNELNATSLGSADGFLAKYQVEASAPLAPTANAETNKTSSAFTANWTSTATAANYRLDVSTSNIFANFISGYENLTVSGLSKELTGLAPGTPYYYQVRAVNDGGTSPNSNMITVITSSPALTAPVANAGNTISATAFMTSWNSVASSTGYQLDVSADDFVTYLPGYQNRSVTITSEGVIGLQAENDYKYRVRAVGAGGTSANSNVITVTTATFPPSASVASAATSITASSFTANWNASGTATGYKLDVSPDNFVTFVAGYNAKTVAGVSDAVTGLIAGKSYQYRVRATNAGGTSLNSNVIIALTLPPPPPAPVATAASSIMGDSFTANWNLVAGASYYKLDVSSDNFVNYVAGFNNRSVAGTSDNVIGLSTGTAYKYRVRAVDDNGTSINSNTIDVSTLPLPDAPVATAATSITISGFVAHWNAVAGATSYRLDVSSDNFSTYVSAFENRPVSITSDAVSGLSPETAYKYRVRAIDAVGTSMNSNAIDATTLALPDAPIAAVATLVTASSFTANWSAVAGATSYRLDVSSDNFASLIAGYSDKTVSITSETVTGLTQATGYKYRVRAVDVNGTSVNSNVIDVTTLALPAAPVALAASPVTATSFTANWNSVAAATSYQLDVSPDNFITFLAGYSNKSVVNLSEAISGLPSATSYKYRVRAVNANGISVNSSEISVTTLPLPAPSAFSASGVSSTGFTASWSSIVGATGYLLYVSADNFATLLPAYSGLNVAGTSASVTGLNPSTTYSYKVRATSASSTSVDSNVVPVTTLVPPPSAPTATAATGVGPAGFTANWSSAAGAASYELDVSTDNFSSFVSGFQAKSVTATSEAVPAGSNTTYQYRVRAVNAGGSSPNSNTISLTTPPPAPDAPVASAATAVTTTGFTASWNSVGGATGYRLDVSADNFSTMLVDYNNKPTSATSVVVMGLQAATPYKYRVRAENGTGASSNSNEVPVTTLPKQNQTITFADIVAVTMGDASFTLSPTSSSGLAVSLSTTSDEITLSGTTVIIVKAGKATITASQAGDDSFHPATPVSHEFCINPGQPSITMTNPLTESPTLSSSSPAGNQWFKEGIAIGGAAGQAETLSVTAPGVYTVQVTVETCASLMSSGFDVIVTGDISSPGNFSLMIAPNPVEDRLLIQLPGTGRKEVVIYHITGVITENFATERSEEEISVKSYAQGQYLVRVRTSEGSQFGKFIKK